MDKGQAKELVRKIFGEDAANDDDIIDFYFRVNRTAMEENAIAFAEWIVSNGYVNRTLSPQAATWSIPLVQNSTVTTEQLYQTFLNTL